MGRVSIERGVLQQLVESVEAFWDDHSFAKTADNPGWKTDEKAIKKARAALRNKDIAGHDTVEESGPAMLTRIKDPFSRRSAAAKG